MGLDAFLGMEWYECLGLEDVSGWHFYLIDVKQPLKVGVCHPCVESYLVLFEDYNKVNIE